MYKRKRPSTVCEEDPEKKKACYANCNATWHDRRCVSANADIDIPCSSNEKENRKPVHAKPYILMQDEVNNDDEDSLYLTDDHIHKIFGALVKSAGNRHRVGYTELYFSKIIKENDVNTVEYMQPSREEISILLVPIHTSAHYTLAVFDLDKKVAYHFDTLMGTSKRKKARSLFKKIKDALERDLNIEFEEMSKADCEALINEQLDAYNCGIHICRIAEEIFFYGFSRRLSPFDIHEERKRIRDIYDAICDPEWNGEWDFPQLQDARCDSVPSTSAACDAPSTSSANHEAPSTSAACDDASSMLNDSQMAALAINETGRPGSPDSIASTGNQQKPMLTHEYFCYLIETVPQISVDIHSIIPRFAQLSVLRTCYQNLEQFRKNEYNRSRQSTKAVTVFDMDVFEKLKLKEIIYINDLVNGFQAYFDLPSEQKIILFKNFYPTFIVFERIFDTVNFMKKKCDGKAVLLQNGCYLNVEDMQISRPIGMDDGDFDEFSRSHWITVTGEKLLPLMIELALHPIEAMYGFGLILMDISQIQSSLSTDAFKAKQEIFDRINADIFQFYGEDKERFKRIGDINRAVIVAKEIATNYMKVYKKLNKKNNGNIGFFIESTTDGSSGAAASAVEDVIRAKTNGCATETTSMVVEEMQIL